MCLGAQEPVREQNGEKNRHEPSVTGGSRWRIEDAEVGFSRVAEYAGTVFGGVHALPRPWRRGNASLDNCGTAAAFATTRLFRTICFAEEGRM